MFFAALVLATVAFSAASIPESILALNIRDNHDVHRVCRSIRLEQYLNIDTTLLENQISSIEKIQTVKILAKINDCCIRSSLFEKKQCLKTVREYYLDTKCDEGINHICCQIIGLQRYSCFAKTPLVTLLLNNDKLNQWENEKLSHLENVNDILAENVYGHNLLNIDEVESEREALELATVIKPLLLKQSLLPSLLKQSLLPSLLKQSLLSRCDLIESDLLERELLNNNELGQHLLINSINSNQVLRKLERIIRLVAKQTCVKNTLKGGRLIEDTCCEAGTLIGATVGRINNKVCIPALHTLLTKVQGCGISQRPECKHVFLQCCQQINKNRRLRENSLILNDELPIELSTKIHDVVIDELLPYPFNAHL